MTTDINELYVDPCRKLDSWCVDAFFELKLDPLEPEKLILDNSWGETSVDLTPAVKASETITHLLLTDTALQFNREDYGREGVTDGGLDCISGDDLSHIISMKYLRDVKQSSNLTDGDVYMWDGNSNLFQTFNLRDFVNTTNTRLKNLEDRMGDVEQRITRLETKLDTFISASNKNISNLQDLTKRPEGIPEDTRIAWGNRNYYTDYTNNNKRTTGIFTHSTAQTLANDTYDA